MQYPKVSFKINSQSGKPRISKSSIDNFIRTLDYMVSNNVGQKLGTKHTSYPIITFKNDLKKYYQMYSVHSYRELLDKIKVVMKY